MKIRVVEPIVFAKQIIYASGSTAFTMLERIILLYMPFYYLPPREYQLQNLIPDRTYYGFFTMLGAALLLGRLIDGLADPIIASLSDNSRSVIGRRKAFLLIGCLPLALSTFLIFSPPFRNEESMINGLWLALILVLFYVSFTIYVNPYLALLPELGHTDHLRINLGTLIALFGLLGMVFAAIALPELVNIFQSSGFTLRFSYRMAIAIFSVLSFLILLAASFAFSESKHCQNVYNQPVPVIKSFKSTLNNKPFKIFLCGEVFLQLAMNMVTLGLIYYAVVLFQREERFLVTLASLTIGGSLISFVFVNKLAKSLGKKAVIMSGVLSLMGIGFVLFLISFNMTGFFFNLGLFMFALAGFPLAVLTVLINPTIADLAKADFLRTGLRREAMFFGTRAIPLKATIAFAGFIFAFLITVFGKDIANPFGIQLTLLVTAVSAFLSYLFFRIYPEEEVRKQLSKENEIDTVY